MGRSHQPLPSAWQGEGWAADAIPGCWGEGRCSVGSNVGSAHGCHRSTEVPRSSPCCGGSSSMLCAAGRNISQHEPLAAPHQSPSAREDRVPAPQLVPISSTALTSAQTPPRDVEASSEGTFKKALLPSPFPFALLLPQNQSCFPRSRRKLVDERRGSDGVCPCSASMDMNVPKRQELQGGLSLARACSQNITY